MRMDGTIKFDALAMSHYSEILIDSGERRIPLKEWIDSYNTAKDGHLKYLLMKCIPLVDDLELGTIIDNVKTDCVYERCDLLLQFLTNHEPVEGSILKWLNDQITSNNLTADNCPSHCICSLLKLGIELIGKGVYWDPNLSIELLKVINNVKHQRCSLNLYLDLIGASVEANIDNYDYLEQIYTQLIFKLNPGDYINLENPINDKPEIMFNGISDCLLLRKFVLPRLMMITRADLNKFTPDEILDQMNDISQQVSGSINWINDPFYDLFMENDLMLLKCVNCIIEIYGVLLKDVPTAHHSFEMFLDSIHHDTGVFIEWLTSDSDIANLILRLLLTYFKLPNSNIRSSEPITMFCDQLLTKVGDLYRSGCFPYNPSALLKHHPKFNQINGSAETN